MCPCTALLFLNLSSLGRSRLLFERFTFLGVGIVLCTPRDTLHDSSSHSGFSALFVRLPPASLSRFNVWLSDALQSPSCFHDSFELAVLPLGSLWGRATSTSQRLCRTSSYSLGMSLCFHILGYFGEESGSSSRLCRTSLDSL